MDESTQVKFDEKLKSLLVLAKKKKNMLDYQEVSAHFSDLNLEEEQFDKIIETLEQNNVDIVRMSDEDDDIVDEDILISAEDEPDVENIDLSVPEGISIEEHMALYTDQGIEKKEAMKKVLKMVEQKDLKLDIIKVLPMIFKIILALAFGNGIRMGI